MDIVTIEGLTKTYPAFTLDAVSFSLAAGRIAGFIGRNGAGKTTTIKSMLNLIHPDSGRICYFGMPLIGNEAQIKKRIGYSTGTISWYPRKKIRTIRDVTKRFYDSWDDATYERYLRLRSPTARRPSSSTSRPAASTRSRATSCWSSSSRSDGRAWPSSSPRTSSPTSRSARMTSSTSPRGES